MKRKKKKAEEQALVRRDPPPAPRGVTEAQVLDYLRIYGPTQALKMTQFEEEAFLEMCVSLQLNPFRREIYAIPFKDKSTGKRTFALVTGYEVYLRRAVMSGKLGGWTVNLTGEGADLRAVVQIKRLDWQDHFTWTVWMAEVAGGGPMWRTMPKFMLRKVAIAQAFRLAFPEVFTGMPRTSEEMVEQDSPGGDDMPSEVTVTATVDPAAEEPKEAPPQEPDPTPVQDQGGDLVDKGDLINYINTSSHIPAMDKADFIGQVIGIDNRTDLTPEQKSEMFKKALRSLKERYSE